MGKNQIIVAKTENCTPVKNFRKVPVKFEREYEKSEKSDRENYFSAVKNRTTPKLAFTGTFVITGKKENAALWVETDFRNSCPFF